MKSIKEKAQEWADIYPSCGMADKSFTEGANYVIEIIEQALTPQKCLTDIGINVGPEALIKTALQTIEVLKKK